MTPPVGIARNSVFNLAAFVYPVVLTVVVTPVILHFIGPTDYGIFALASIFVSFLGLLDFGMAPAVTKFVSERLALGEQDTAGRIVGATLLFYAGVGIMGAATSTAIAFLLLPHVFHLAAADVGKAQFVFVVGGLDFLLMMVMNPLAAVPPSLQRYDVTAKITFVLTTITAVASVAAVASGLGVEGLAVAGAAEPVIGLLIYPRVDRGLMPSLRIRARWDPPLLRTMFAFSGYSFFSNLSGSLLLQLDKFVLGIARSVTAVTFYVVPGNVAQRLHTATTGLTGVLLPAASDMYARGDEAGVRRLYVRATRLTVLFVFSITVPTIVFARQILLEWLGAAFATHSFWALRLLVMTYFMLSLTPIPYFIVLARGRPRIAAAFSAATAVLNVVLILVLIPRYGVVGAAGAFLLSMATVPFLLRYVERSVLELAGRFWGRLALGLLAPTALAVGFGLALRQLAVDLPLLLVLLAIDVAILPLACFATGFFDEAERRLIVSFLRPRSLPRPRPPMPGGEQP